jgi:hypothetical protein
MGKEERKPAGLIVIGRAKGITRQCPIDYLQENVYEQIPTAKRNVIRQFNDIGISESEIIFEY